LKSNLQKHFLQILMVERVQGELQEEEAAVHFSQTLQVEQGESFPDSAQLQLPTIQLKLVLLQMTLFTELI
jgi:hypothetical protein